LGDLRERGEIVPDAQIRVTDGHREHGAGTGLGVRTATIWTCRVVTALKPLTTWFNAWQLLFPMLALSDNTTP